MIDVGGVDQPFVLYTSDLGRAGFSAGAMEIPAGAEFDLNRAVNGAAVGSGGTIESASMTTFEGFPATEYLLAIEDEGAYVRGLIVQTPTRVYQIHAIGPDNPPSGYDHFKASFHIATAS